MLFLRCLRLFLLLLLLLLGVVFILISALASALGSSQFSILSVGGTWYRLLLVVMNIKVSVKGNYQHQGALICSNHISWLDIPVLGSVLPTYFLSKAEVRSVPILGWLAHQAGTLFIERGGKQITQVKTLMQAYLSNDHCLTFFPEATTGNGWAIRQFHPRLFAAAIETNTPVLPVSIKYNDASQPELSVAFGDESMATNLWRILGRVRTSVTVSLLPVIQTGELERKVLAETAMNLIGESLHLPVERRGPNFRAPLPTTPPEPRVK